MVYTVVKLGITPDICNSFEAFTQLIPMKYHLVWEQLGNIMHYSL
jgi:hypothetical protein